MSQETINGFEAILAYWETAEFERKKMLAYILATAYHETKRKPMQPVREGFCRTDNGSRKAVANLFRRQIIRRNYAIPHPNGNSYYGRGLVQLTHGDNYKMLGREMGLGDRLYKTPDMALDLVYSVQIHFLTSLFFLFVPY